MPFSKRLILIIAATTIAAATAIPAVAINAQDAQDDPQQSELNQNNNQTQPDQSAQSPTTEPDKTPVSPNNDLANNPSFAELIQKACHIPNIEGFRQRVSITTWDIKASDISEVPQISGPGATMSLDEFCEQLDNNDASLNQLGQINFRY